MKIYNDLRLRFEQQVWEKSPELAVIDSIIVSYPQLVEIVMADIIEGLKNNKFGRKDNPTVEQVLRLAIYKEIRKLNYEDLEFHQFDSQTCKEFVLLDGRKPFSSSVMQEYISKIQAKNLEQIMIFINRVAFKLGYEDGETIRIDSTKSETNIQQPTNNSLTYDCIKTAGNIIAKLHQEHSDAWNKLESRRMEAKKLNYNLNNVKIKEDYKDVKKETKSVATDGGYASSDNLGFAKSNKLVNIVFTKVVGSLKSVAESAEIEDMLTKWRSGIEGCISNVKQGFNLGRVTWKGWEMFNAKVFWSVIAYNIRVLTGHILGTMKTI